jgi:hypothetical protein
MCTLEGALLTKTAGTVAPPVIACFSRETFRQGLHFSGMSRASGGYGG